MSRVCGDDFGQDDVGRRARRVCADWYDGLNTPLYTAGVLSSQALDARQLKKDALRIRPHVENATAFTFSRHRDMEALEHVVAVCDAVIAKDQARSKLRSALLAAHKANVDVPEIVQAVWKEVSHG